MFHFKQFDIEDADATMRVGTNAVLLGALATPSVPPTRILDIGTGCGVLALMMAQRFPAASIDAIDIDEATVRQASDNAKHSRWAKNIHCHNTSLQEYALHEQGRFDLIISNPPYFTKSMPCNDKKKQLARHDDRLTSDELFSCSAELMEKNGIMSIIIPYNDTKRFIESAGKSSMSVIRQEFIFTKPEEEPKLNILHFGLSTDNQEQTIEHSIRNTDGKYSEWYIKTTEPFLL